MLGAGNYTFTFDGTSFTGQCDKVDIDETTAELDATFGDATATGSEPGLKTYKITASGAWSKALDAKLRASGKKTAVLSVGSGSELVTYTWTTQAFVSNYKRTMGAKDRLDWSATFNLSGLPTVA